MDKIRHHLNSKTKKVLLWVLFFVLVFSIGRIIFDIRLGPPRELFDKSFAGVVVDAGETNFTVRDRFGNLKVFENATNTKVSKDQFVMVQSEMDLKNPSPIYTTKSVRLLEKR